MDFSIDSEQEALQGAVRGLITKAYDSSETRREVVKAEPGYGEGTWRKLAEMGILGLPFDEKLGGMGAGPVEVSLVAEELGRVLAPEPFVESVVLAGGLIAAAADEAQAAELLTPLAEGASLPILAWFEAGRRWDATPAAVTAASSGDAWTLSGVKEPVPWGASADVLIVSAATEAGTGLFLVSADADGLERGGYTTHDGLRAARVSFDGTPATPLGDVSADQSALLGRALDAARIAYAHEAVGAMETALQTTVGYLKTRKQFGVTLNSFQALTFRAADMYTALELARSTAAWATMVLDAATEGAEVDVTAAASQAALQISRAGRHLGQEAIQLHGGIGVTAEYSVGHYTSRLTAIEHLIGDGAYHRARLAAAVSDHEVLDPIG
ncbi:acyl-CoA dehydrogenase [Aeromicrobium sp. PE09-221]|uniref:acyl-CoA dehydrogenase family protein n=1 Tax=Aeromicrobium sp. PE09-221 TaxID=1898043 RepID=UPI000B3EC194|nr:acyl-CoA dehydrogenase family protein [Aeromicrobium sp. PE09-221]OUZ12374.1 acyl-CoA dehydrogenase [Aeromicrobium sp. PE09-221]